MDFLEPFVKRLKGPLLLLLGIDVLCGYSLLKGEGEPPQIPVFNKVSVILVWILSIVAAAWLYRKDRELEAAQVRRRDEEKARSDAEEKLPGVIKSLLTKGEAPRDIWTRPMLQLPLPEAVFDEVFQVFDGALRATSQALSEWLPELDRSRIRANLFLPTSEGARNGDVCDLVIPAHALAAPNGLQKNMQAADERAVTFRPNQGATGRVFAEKRAVGVLTHPGWLNEKDSSRQKEIERWIYVRLHPEADLSRPGEALQTASGKGQFEMNDFQNRRVDETLAWLISVPIFLKIDEALEVVGVFNLDCLDYQITPEQLRMIYYSIAPFAGAVSGVMHALPMDRVAIVRVRE
jgi:hypothetical protein